MLGCQDHQELVDIGEYAVFCSRTSAHFLPTSGSKKAYWFPDRSVKAGDLVILYTKAGKTSTKALSEGRTAHFFYWAQESALWGRSSTAVVLEISDWIYKNTD